MRSAGGVLNHYRKETSDTFKIPKAWDSSNGHDDKMAGSTPGLTPVAEFPVG